MNQSNKGLTILGWLFSLAIIGPIYIMVINSFKSREQIFTDQLGLPEVWSFQYYQEAAQKMNYFNSLKNSLVVVGISVIFIVIVASMAAWAIARRGTKGANLLYFMFISTILIPFQSVMLPLVQYFTNWRIPSIGFNMVGTHYGLIFFNIGFGLTLSVFLYTGAVKNVPVSMEESARIDGAGTFQTFWRIVFPNLGPITVTVGILNVISYWNDYLLPSLVLTQNPNLRTIPLSTFYFFGEFNIQWNLALAGLVMTIIPVILVYIVAQRWIISGIMAGAVKG
ncbi:MAG: carbohydrate ABC transporter permease [Clostridiaceae bacterium]|nr:carbohydrate ABC transporter permease [Clostridiaceae bacterium]